MTTRRLILGTAGHIDHGKTALVRALTGIDTDRLPEEKKRGITIDLGFAYLDLDDVRVGIVDVPGHERFIRNMLAGAAGIDMAMLIVAADDSIMPQTREHLEILQWLNIQRGVVAITKIDRVEPSWVDLVEEDVRDLVAGTFLADAPIVRTSAISGEGVDALRATLGRLCKHIEDDERTRPFRMAIDRCFVLTGLGTIVTGSPASGQISIGDTLEWQPIGRSVQVRSLQSHGESVTEVRSGQRAAVNLAGAHHTEVHRGHELATPGYLRPSRRLTVRLNVSADSPWPLRHRARLRFHLGTQEIIVRVLLLNHTQAQPGESAIAQMLCVRPVCAIARQPFVIRAESPVRTIGGGIVLQPTGGRVRRNDEDGIAQLAKLADDDPRVRSEAALRFYSRGKWSDLDLCRDADLSLDEAAAIMHELEQEGVLTAIGDVRLHRQTLREAMQRVGSALAGLHEASPLDSSVPRSQLLRRLRGMDERLLDTLLTSMKEQGTIVSNDRSVALADFKPKLSDSQRQLYGAVSEQLRAAACSPPSSADLAKLLGASERDVRAALDLGVGQGDFVHVGAGVILHCECERRMRDMVAQELESRGEMTLSEIRTRLQTSRKYAVPICEYLDRTGITRRIGDKRVLTRSRR